ncbi:MAG: hypothetical protein IJ770_03955 [Alphaproteobacteria bacterium]|nr:hypothetical protein [Alphaproteobacteria bacterium]
MRKYISFFFSVLFFAVSGSVLTVNDSYASICLLYDENCMQNESNAPREDDCTRSDYYPCLSEQVTELKSQGWKCSSVKSCAGKCYCQPKEKPTGESGEDNMNKWPEQYRNADGSNNSDLYNCKISGQQDGIFYWKCTLKEICTDKKDSYFVISKGKTTADVEAEQEKICNADGYTFIKGESKKSSYLCGHCAEHSSGCKRGVPENEVPSGCYAPCKEVGKATLKTGETVKCCVFEPMFDVKKAEDIAEYHRPEKMSDCYITLDKKSAADGEYCYKQQKMPENCAEGYVWNDFVAAYEPMKEHCSCVPARCPEGSAAQKPEGCFEYFNVGKSAADICWKTTELSDVCASGEVKNAKECPYGAENGGHTACGKQCYVCKEKADTCPLGQTDNAEKCKVGYDLGTTTKTGKQCYICKDENSCPEGQTDNTDDCAYGFDVGAETENGKQCYKCHKPSCRDFGYDDVCTDGCRKDVLTMCSAKYLPNGLTCYETTKQECVNGCGPNGCALCPAGYTSEKTEGCYDTVVGADGVSACYKEIKCCADKDFVYEMRKPEIIAGYDIKDAQGVQGGYCQREKVCPENETTVCTESLNDTQCVVCNPSGNYSASAQCFAAVEKSNICAADLVKNPQDCEYGAELGQATECGAPCYKCKICKPKDCSEYTIEKKPHTAETTYDVCDAGCKQALRYRCKAGFEYRNGGCVEPCPADYPYDGKCPEAMVGKDTYTTFDGRYCFDCGKVTEAEAEYRCADEWVGNTHYFYTTDVLTGYSYPNGCCVKDPCSGVYREGYIEGVSKSKDNGGDYWCCMAGYKSEASSVYFPSDTPHCRYVGKTGTYCGPNTTGPSETHYFCKVGKLVGKKCVE